MVLQPISSILPNFLNKQVTNKIYRLGTKRHSSTAGQFNAATLLELSSNQSKLLTQTIPNVMVPQPISFILKPFLDRQVIEQSYQLRSKQYDSTYNQST